MQQVAATMAISDMYLSKEFIEKLLKVSNGEIVLTVVQPDGKGKMKAVDFARGLVNKGALEGRILS